MYIISESPDVNGYYNCEQSVLESLNRIFPESQTVEMLQWALLRLWGGGDYYRLDDTVMLDKDNLLIGIEPECFLSIPDIRSRIATDPDGAEYYVLVDSHYKQFRWIVCVPGDTIFQGQRTDTLDVANVAK